MSNSQGKVLLSPTSTDGVYITTTHTAALDLDVDIVVTKWLWLELVLVKLQPGLRTIDLETSELIGVRHLDVGTKDNSIITGEGKRKRGKETRC